MVVALSATDMVVASPLAKFKKMLVVLACFVRAILLIGAAGVARTKLPISLTQDIIPSEMHSAVAPVMSQKCTPNRA